VAPRRGAPQWAASATPMFRFTKVENKVDTIAKQKLAITDVHGYAALVVHFYNSG